MASLFGKSIFSGGNTSDPGDILNEKNTPSDMTTGADAIREKVMNHSDYVNFLYADGHVKGYPGKGEEIFSKNNNNGLSDGITGLIKGLVN